MGDTEAAAQGAPAEEPAAPTTDQEPEPTAQSSTPAPDDTGGVAQPDSKYEG
jgi:hypothetical protein